MLCYLLFHFPHLYHQIDKKCCLMFHLLQVYQHHQIDKKTLPSVPLSTSIPISTQSLNWSKNLKIPKLPIPQPKPPSNSLSSPQISLLESSNPPKPMMIMHNKPSTTMIRGDLQLQPELHVYSWRNISKGVEKSVNLQRGNLS